ncbi:carbonyl reductase [NADPH] 3-like [Bombyx mandarina]|uniref:Carbonyl reductase [NADPH] 3-like n=1 Tax=Bombyx mandarina TaxID=7092 RepID=A0A6J2J8Y9_BOMMA|nr:carbonyl reductase [NADPH] 3-like [Bombyx mandarina]
MSNDYVAIVTGANKGLGFAIVKDLCENFKGTVYLTSRDETRGNEACEILRKLGLKPEYHQLDVSDPQSVQRFASYIQNKRVEILINNAGILFLKDAKEPKLFQAEQTILTNYFALVNFCEAILPCVKEGGKIINISSSSGHLSRIPSADLRKRFMCENLTLNELNLLMRNYMEAVKNNEEIDEGWGDSPYVVSKVGVNAYTFILNRKLSSKGIIANCVHPGYVMSDMTRGAGNVSPEQAAKLVTEIALNSKAGGLYIWHNGDTVNWNGPDPRGFIDGKI